MANAKVFTVVKTMRNGSLEFKGTVQELTESFSYTLECGASYQFERGNKKINLEPKTIKSLVLNLNKAVNNSAANGYSGTVYSVKE